MPDRDTFKTLDLALRVGEMLLANGAGAADVTATMLAVTQACGLRGVTTDVTFSEISVNYQASLDAPAINQVRHVNQREIDYQDLTGVDHLVRDLVGGHISRDEARDRLARIISTGHARPRWAVNLGWGVMGAGVALLLGGDALVALLASLSAMTIDLIQRSMSRRRLPVFYQQVAGGLAATLIAVGAAGLGLDVAPSRVVTAGIVMLLAGIGFMGAIQDALTGFPITATARILEAILLTAGIIAGVSLGLTIGAMLVVDLGAVEPGATGLAEASVMTFGAALSAAAFAFSTHAPLRSLLPVFAVTALGASSFVGIQTLGFGPAWSSAVAAFAVGVVSYSTAGRFRVPPLVVVVPAVVPLLPGLAIYRGLALLADGRGGMLHLAAAGAIATAIASGVILGQYLSQPLKREARRLETRLSGPRLVGPLKARVGVRRSGGAGRVPGERSEAARARVPVG